MTTESWQGQFEILWNDGEFTVSRATPKTDGASALVVRPVVVHAGASLAWFEHAHAIRGELEASWAARPTELIEWHGEFTLRTEDPGGQVLASLLGKPWDIGPFLRVAAGVASAIGGLHRQGLVHQDIKPSNILVDFSMGKAWLVGFGLTTRATREGHAPSFPRAIAGTLAYMAPEQTGRMNRSVDTRSDLYSLGVMFYEMLTGARPFEASEPLEWIHCHVARQPSPPSDRAPGIPAAVSALVLRLLAKNPEDRYQTARGVEADLRGCLAEWDATGGIEPPPLAAENARLYADLHEAQAYLAEAQRLSATGSFGWKPATGELVWSEETHRIFALDRSAKPTVEFVLSRTHPEDRDALRELVDRATRESQDVNHAYRLLMPDGTAKHVHIVAQAGRDEVTGDALYVGAVMDITAAKESRQALEKAYAENQEL